ncbi:hypothetical protein DPMN_018275 [Dreissena polymorpha]|uniref:Uncharacterized protein n=1 Tax=Dreissena polymorpha TaxID=45954 RepID=A0A9D4NJ26_DREPO|nr:hypothetical protein DPMN_018275 [Dreissena polymorpha]
MEMTCAVYTGTIAGLLFLTLVLGLILCCRKSETSKSSTQIAVNMTKKRGPTKGKRKK